MANAGNFQGTNTSSNYYVKNKNYPLTAYNSLDKYRQNKLSGCCISIPIPQPPPPPPPTPPPPPPIIGAPTIEDIYNIDVMGTAIIIDIEYANDEPTVPDIVDVQFI